MVCIFVKLAKIELQFSDGYSSLDINLAWKDTSPVNVASDIHIAAFQLDSITNVICNSVTPTGTYSTFKSPKNY